MDQPTATSRSDATVDPARRHLDRLVRASRWILLWERLWPLAWLPVSVVLAFLAASWLGLWLDLPPLGRQIGVALFALALAGSLWPAARLRLPGRKPALDRLDRTALGGHRPARALSDTLAAGGADAGSRALWALHVRGVERALGQLRVSPPHPGMTRRDPFAIRAAALLATVACAFVAGPDVLSRLATAFEWRVAGPVAQAFRVDGWIDPPLYTRLPPLMIDLAAGEQHLKAPLGSTIVIRVAGRGDATLTPGANLTALPGPETRKAEGQQRLSQNPELQRSDLKEQRYRLNGNADLGIRTGLARSMRLVVEAIPDHAPEITLSGAPELDERGNFTLTYRMRDDYGIASAEAAVTPSEGPANRHTLVPAPRLPLTLPADPRDNGETKTVAELSDHPWGGARVRLTLSARDDAGQEGHSLAVDFTLPQRPFTNPLARALVEQRRNLVLDPDHRGGVQTALDALLIAPDMFTPEWGVFLGLRSAAHRLRVAGNDGDLTEVAEFLWAMALQIEEGNLTEAERELKAAQDRLRDAVDRGADEGEIRRLTEQLKTAMDKFLREFAQRMERDRQNGDQTARGPERTISQNDLNRMLNEMQDAMKRGDTAEAQRLLEQLRNILENLKTAKSGNRMSDPQAREMNRQVEELDRMARDQQQLRDETFREGQQNRRAERNGKRPQQGQRGQQGRQGQKGQGQDGQGQDGQGDQEAGSGEGQQPGGDGLGSRQGALRERLGELQRRMRGLGMQGEQGLADAEGEMREAEKAIGQDQDGRAVDSQGRALEGLQRGMQGMAQQMQKMLGQNDGQDQDGDPNGPGNPTGRAQNDARSDDPLGRPTRGREFSDGRVRVPGANESAVERARRILEELRRKLGDPSRPQEELDYFERLLKRN